MIEESEKLKSTAEDKASRMADRLVPYTLGLVQNPTAAVNQLTNPAVLRLVSGILEQAQEHGAQVYLLSLIHISPPAPAAI